MIKQILVLVPRDTPPNKIEAVLVELLAHHKNTPNQFYANGRYEHLLEEAPKKSLDDHAAVQQMPKEIRDKYPGNICGMNNLPYELVPFGLVTPNGKWFELFDFGWRVFPISHGKNIEAFQQWEKLYRELVDANPDCWVLEVYVESSAVDLK